MKLKFVLIEPFRNRLQYFELKLIIMKYLILLSLTRMKKFLQLKKTIVDSKNQPTLMQTYLDTIRSSCYKLATPRLSPKSRNTQKPKQQSTFNQFAEGNKETNFVETCKYTPNAKEQQMTKVETPPQTPVQDKNMHHKGIQRIDQIFQTLSEHCQSSRVCAGESQKLIIQKIMENLDKLSLNGQFKESIQLIRKIICSMGKRTNFQQISNHSNLGAKGKQYIVEQKQIGMIDSDRDHQNFKNQLNSEDYLMENSLKLSSKQNYENKKKSNFPIYIHDQEQTKYSPPVRSEERTPFDDLEDLGTSRKNYLQDSNSMISESINEWKYPDQYNLYSIEEQEEQESKSDKISEKHSSIPQETIQFKKILYMLESSTLKKKDMNSLFEKIDHRKSTKSLFTNECEQIKNKRVYTEQDESFGYDFSPQTTKKSIKSYTQLLKQKGKLRSITYSDHARDEKDKQNNYCQVEVKAFQKKNRKKLSPSKIKQLSYTVSVVRHKKTKSTK